MRILMTTDTVGGVWVFTQELAAGLLAHGHSILLVSFGRYPSSAQREQCEMLARHYEGHFQYVASEIPLEWMEENEQVFDDGAALLRVEAAWFGPDVLHSSQFCYGASDLGVPRVVTAHSDVLSWARACRGERLEDSPWLRRYTEMVQAGLAEADAVTAPTLWMAKALAKSFRLPSEVVVIANGRSIAIVPHGLREVRAVTAGRLWDEGKGIDILRDVQSPLGILIAGEIGPGQTNATALPASCQLIGYLSEPEMIDVLHHSSIYLCLSKYEPFGLAALDAALCGCAVLARQLPSLKEVWGEGALYFKDARSLSKLLQRLYDTPGELHKARAQSQRRAQAYGRERMVEHYETVFREAMLSSLRRSHAA